LNPCTLMTNIEHCTLLIDIEPWTLMNLKSSNNNNHRI
jgi:hypothetical protein